MSVISEHIKRLEAKNEFLSKQKELLERRNKLTEYELDMAVKEVERLRSENKMLSANLKEAIKRKDFYEREIHALKTPTNREPIEVNVTLKVDDPNFKERLEEFAAKYA